MYKMYQSKYKNFLNVLVKLNEKFIKKENKSTKWV